MIKIQPIDELVPPKMLAALSPAALDTVIYNVAQSARNHWIKLASKDSQRGSHWRFDYISGIQPVSTPQMGTAVIALVGEIPHMLEDGAPSMDMRDTLLGPNVQVAPVGQRGKHASAKGGYYRAIPFRHTTQGTKGTPRGKTAGQEMGSAYSGHAAVGDSKKLGKQIYKAAKALSATTTAPKKKTAYGGRLTAGMAPKLRPHHKTDIYAGMIRSEKTYEGATQAQYGTFRTISTLVTTGWIRAAIPARHYANDVSTFIRKLVPQAVSAMLEAK